MCVCVEVDADGYALSCHHSCIIMMLAYAGHQPYRMRQFSVEFLMVLVCCL